MGDRATRDASVGRTNAHLMLAAPAVALLGGAAMGFMAGGAVGAGSGRACQVPGCMRSAGA